MVFCSSAISQEENNLFGRWEGQAQFKVIVDNKESVGNKIDDEIELNIDQLGKISGKTSKNGCDLKGLAKRTLDPGKITLHIQFIECKLLIDNNIYGGSLSMNKETQQVSMELTATRMVYSPPRLDHTTLDAVLHR